MIEGESMNVGQILQPMPAPNGQLAFVPRSVPVCEICVAASEKATADAAKSRLVLPHMQTRPM